MRSAMEKENCTVNNLVHVTKVFKDFKMNVGLQFHISVWIVLISLWHPEHFTTHEFKEMDDYWRNTIWWKF